MAHTYNPIAPTETDPDGPLNSSLAKRWSDNWEAGFEGATGAPRINLAAFGVTSPGGNVIDRLSPAGLIVSVGSITNGGSGSLTISNPFLSQFGFFSALNAGSVTISGNTTANATGTAIISSRAFTIYKNNIAAANITTNGGFSVNISFSYMDTIHFGFSLSGSTSAAGGSVTASVDGLNVLANSRYLWRT